MYDLLIAAWFDEDFIDVAVAGSPPPVRRPRVVSQAGNRALLQRRFYVDSRLGKPHGYATRNAPIRPLRVLTQAIKQRKAVQPRLRTRAVLGHPHGYVTRKPPIRPLLVRGQAGNRAVLQRRFYTDSRLGKPRKPQAVVVAAHARKPLVVSQALNRQNFRSQIRTSAVLGEPFGATRKVPIPALRFIGQAIKNRIAVRSRLRTHAILGKPPARVVVVSAQHVRAPQFIAQAGNRQRARFIAHARLGKPRAGALVVSVPRTRAPQVLSQAVSRGALHLRTRAVLRRPFGYVTRMPPVRGPRVLLQAEARRALNSRLRTTVSRSRVFGSLVFTAVFPDPGDVRDGIVYGPHGADFIGTFVCAGGGAYTPRRSK
jgi:hypothetical protein